MPSPQDQSGVAEFRCQPRFSARKQPKIPLPPAWSDRIQGIDLPELFADDEAIFGCRKRILPANRGILPAWTLHELIAIMPGRRTGGGSMQRIAIGEVSLEVAIAGDGAPLLFLHGGDYFAQNHAFLERLARHWRVFAPRHPGFGGSGRPDGFRTIHDLAYLYLDMIEQHGLDDAVLVGSSFGGWIALEMCVGSMERVGRLVLV